MIFWRWVGPHWKALYLEWHSWKQMSRTCQLHGWMLEAERGAGIVEHYDGNVCSQSWYRLRTNLGRLHEGSVVCNTAAVLTVDRSVDSWPAVSMCISCVDSWQQCWQLTNSEHVYFVCWQLTAVLTVDQQWARVYISFVDSWQQCWRWPAVSTCTVYFVCWQ